MTQAHAITITMHSLYCFQEEPMEGCGDGTWQGVRYFRCPPKQGFFSPLSSFMPDKRADVNRESYLCIA